MMRIACAALLIALASVAPLRAGEDTPTAFDWQRWHDLPVQNGGRQKPLDTLGWELLRLVGNRSSFADPETGEKLDAVALYLSMLFEWQGWDHPQRDRLLLQTDWRSLYFHLHHPDRWDEAPLLRVDYLELRARLGLEQDEQYVSPAALCTTLVEEPSTGRKIRFSAWAEQLLQQEEKGAPLSKLEKKALDLAHRLWTYQNHRMGQGLEILPVKGSAAREWVPVAHFFLTTFDNVSDPTGHYREVQKLLREIRRAYQAGDGEAFNQSVDALKVALRDFGPELGEYPAAFPMQFEVAYNRWVPFRFAWVFALLGVIGMLLHLGTGWNSWYRSALAVYVLALVAIVVGFAMRVTISGRAPVTNMYESVIYVGLGVALFGLVFELIYRAKYILTAAAAVCTVILVPADNSPTVLDPSVRPLEPVLRSNFWLVTHVMTITLSYAAFALALGIANITLGYFLVGSSNQNAISALSRFTYKALQVGVLLLAAGTILGGVWADYSWGRFWGWDPKEVWALVALLGYLCVMHARFAGWVGHRGLAALSVGCFALIVMAWYGVNFVLGAGLHSYGFGGGGQGGVYTAVILELAYTGLALWRSRPRETHLLAQRPSPEAPVVLEYRGDPSAAPSPTGDQCEVGGGR